eukprot:5830599-Pyramimonas_sp.AAC.1
MFCDFEGFWSNGSQTGVDSVLAALESPPQFAQHLGPAHSFLGALRDFIFELRMYEAKGGPLFDFFARMVGAFQTALSEVEASARKLADKDWRGRLLFEAHRGARRVHAASNGAAPWTPAATLSLDGV